MSLANWRIGYRLGAGFAILILMLFVVSIFSLSKLSSFQDSARSIVKDVYPQTVDSNSLIDNVNSILVAYQRLMLVSDQTQIQTNVARVNEFRQEIGRLLDKLESQTVEERSVSQLRAIRAIRNEFLKSGDKIISEVVAGNRDAAIEEFNNNLNVTQRQYRDAVRQLVNYQDDAMDTSVEAMAEVYSETRIILLLILALGAVFGALIAWSITRSVTRPIQQALQVADRVAQGDLTSRITVTSKDETGLLLQSLDHMNTSLSTIVGQVRDGAETISTAASQIAAGNQDLSARTEEQASSLEETAASMEQLTSTIKNTAENTQQATEIANKASGAAKQSGDVMVSVTQKMRGIRDSSQRMAEIIGVIDGIAFQTNILALNAAVEAARAGEQGRGFAVVAGEVRSLAQRSATAAREIKDLIDDSVSKIQEGMSLVDTAEETMGGLTGYVRDVNEIISEISQASREQSDGINQMNLAVGQIDTTTQQNAALVEESASAALSLQAQASVLAEAVSAFKLLSYGSGKTASYASAPVRTPTLSLAPAAAKDQGNNSDWTSF
ncbi:MCP four helix bundle domain-containing protein [Pectobacterium aroidearum]|uniref:MCP four helix bundle domain-containing protein n=1 Tax=Pectobacterium aroidearum TaxID=1201031 RepID=A0ABR5ZH57_9GAMM|nr:MULTISPECIES: methyl-accepting chemotaxis protein [Pectobacterium]MBA5201113.1 MCP four helix bundle domain-containing protein [Pectobacterium aroidearum]MBA5229367.1 MCP four helix bundle domain-containing protein [Pectobacterium aroidearum]MBA5233905.1 MCP four helix bundle domain-containing protein [Pectobacterium aroidearum]MBA5237374.1 MCP four helix bundle domain-containing protein [Pectobacterium aroidearum]MBA5739018.1 MCP four helix bundle domain-containing protein [Pectobacterium 